MHTPRGHAAPSHTAETTSATPPPSYKHERVPRGVAVAEAPPASMPRSVRIVEVGPRDGLQNESHMVDTHTKIALVHDLANAGLQTVEVTAFVSPKWVPQLSDASRVLRAIRKHPDVAYPVLVPNMRGFTAAVAAGAREVAVFASASEAFSQRNINCSIAESMRRFTHVTAAARPLGIKVRAYVSCVVACPYEGHVHPQAVAALARALFQLGCYEISLGDTIGMANPRSITRVVDAVVRAGVPVSALAIHCHDTRGAALANVLAAMSRGVRVVDSSVAGLGGCPYAPGAPGNLATEDLVYMLQGMGVDIGPIRLDKLLQIGQRISTLLNRKSSSKVALSPPLGKLPLTCSQRYNTTK